MSDIETGGPLTVSDNLWARDRAGNGVFIKRQRGTGVYNLLLLDIRTHANIRTTRGMSPVMAVSPLETAKKFNTVSYILLLLLNDPRDDRFGVL